MEVEYAFFNLNIEGCAKKNRTHILFHSIFIIKNYAFAFMYTQRRHFGNSKMANWVNIDQELTKIQGII